MQDILYGDVAERAEEMIFKRRDAEGRAGAATIAAAQRLAGVTFVVYRRRAHEITKLSELGSSTRRPF